jgi:hypothetical protein
MEMDRSPCSTTESYCPATNIMVEDRGRVEHNLAERAI